MGPGGGTGDVCNRHLDSRQDCDPQKVGDSQVKTVSTNTAPTNDENEFDQAAVAPAPPRTAPKTFGVGLPKKEHRFILTGLVVSAIIVMYAGTAAACIVHQIDVATFKELILGFSGLLSLAGVAFAHLFRN
jgi:hypothetical protein